MADHIGLHMARDAFRYFRKNHTLELLPTTNFTLEEMMFVMRAYDRCWSATDFYWSSATTHPPSFHRINRGFSNFKPFASTFNCEPPSKMVAKSPCEVFY